MIRSALQNSYIKACLNPSRTAPVKKFAMSTRNIVSSVAIPKLKDQSLFKESGFINNEWTTKDITEKFTVYDPATDKEIGQLPDMGAKETKEAIQAASEAFKSWSKTTGKQRHDLLIKWYQAMMENQEDLATILTWENGKTWTEAKGEVAYAASFYEWFAEEAVRAYGTVIPSHIPGQRFVTIKQPVGVVGIITPWNFPAAMITRKVGAALAAGCTVVIKPGAETPYTALALAELAKRVGIPPGVVNIVPTEKNVAEVGKELCTNPIVKKISFTGSTAVGKLLMSQSSGTMKKVSMELGGNAAFIVFDDADVDAAVDAVIACKFRGSGQTCVSANRIYVQKSVYKDFSSRLAEKVNKFQVGHGFDEKTTHGPLINSKGIDKVKRHVEDSVSKGAQILAGGKHHGGNFFAPTVLGDMTADMEIHSEETFGPVAALFPFETEQDVISLANDTPFGLANYFFSRDIGRCWRVAENLESGMVGVNTGIISSCYAPFGGVKESGVGREGSKFGLDDYMNIKYINMGGI
ncbi:Aldehyde/histidinol dehydrogenase [Gilbertella persicaria]|uniref:Aldehyde/histidinol dehydrogenase n=1 Tax=Gilbertella persicaria TaxID=101096 RepID=UPI0022205CE2|nr:Aldehyde/histidinol dehydrogenase [Gilbertella persicaria]KAI8098422.1 Aldehyde/histidinol dehydrogenase [Gilbertella persicaria]